MYIGLVVGVVWGCVHKENQPTASRGRVSYPQEVEGWREVSTLFCTSDPWYQLPAAMFRRLSHPASQTGPSVVVGPCVCVWCVCVCAVWQLCHCQAHDVPALVTN